MKKKLVLMLAIISVLCCLLAIGVSAETVLKPQDNNAYGELSFFDESITVGRTDNQNGFSPYIDEAGTTYARVVIGDGTTFYTFPTAYVYSSSRIYGSGGKTLWSYDFASLNSAMETATGTNPGWKATNVYRIELPYNTDYINSDGTQKFYGFSNVIEIYLQPNSTTIDTGSTVNCLFHSCEKLTTIHNIDSFVFKSNNTLSGTFQNCKSLTSLTLGVSPNITKISSSMFNSCTNLVSVNVLEAFPNAKEFGASAFINCTNLKGISANRCDGVIVIPERFWYFENQVFQNCESITAVKFTGSSVKLLQNVFHSLDSLEYIYFPRDSKLELPSCEVFSNNAKLNAVALPDNCTLIPDRGFKNCASLKAVYLPENLYELRSNGWDQGAFTSDPELYFVNDWFNVLDESGEFLFDKFEMPERPDVYYFPSTLQVLFEKSGGTGFYNCYKINPYLVFDTNVTQMIAGDGLLINCGTKGETKTAVFLGDMTKVCHSSQDSRLQNIQYVFANANDKSVSDVEIVNNNTKNPGNTAKIYFCASNTSYQMIAKNGTYGESLGGAHFVSPNATVVSKADCTTPEGSTFYCFCGTKTGEEITSPALGHQQSSISEIIYEGVTKFFEVGDIEYYCERCEENHTEGGVGQAKAIFTFVGYSATELEMGVNAIIQGFKVDHDALALYNANTDFTVVGYGLVAGTELALGSDAEIFDNEGNVTAQKAGVVNVSARDEKYDLFEMRVSGLSGTVEVEGADPIDLAKLNVYCCGYCLIQTPSGVASYYASNGTVTETLNGASSYEDLQQ